MTRDELNELRSWLNEQVTLRKGLGGYSQEAIPILNLFEVALKLANHAKPDKPKAKKK